MQGKQPAYFTAYRSIKLIRDNEGVLVGEFHSKGGPLTFTASDHTDFVECFYRISQDRVNKPLKERIVREVGYGLSLEGASATDLVKSMQANNEPAARKRKSA